MVERQDGDGGSQADPPGALGERAHEDGHRRTDAVLREVVLGEPHGIVAELVGVRRLREDVGVYARLCRPLRLLEEKEHAEFHHGTSAGAGLDRPGQ